MVVYADPYPQDTVITDEMFQYDIENLVPKSTPLQSLVNRNNESFVNLGIEDESDQIMITYSFFILVSVILILLLVLMMLKKK
jgi:hypothetical protein